MIINVPEQRILVVYSEVFHFTGNILHEAFPCKRILRKLPEGMTRSYAHGEGKINVVL